MAETLTIRTASSTEVVKIASVGPQGPKGDKGDPGDVAGLPLTTLGDTLYRGASENQRLPIGTSGQILKVSTGGIPEWGAAPATGVTSVALASSDLTITGSPITSSGTITANVAVNALTLNKLEQISTAHFLGRHSAHGGDVQPVSATQARTILNVADGAEANVQSNWTEADSGSDAFILNKPTLGNSAALNVGTTAGTVAAGDDARLSDSRTPTAHAASHAAGGSDPLELVNLAATGTGEGELAVSQGDGTVAWQNGTTWAGLNITAIDVGAAADDHTHGNLTNDGKVGSTSGLPLVTTTAGAVTTLALGTAGQVLRTKSDLSGVEFADPAAAGVTGASSSASDVLGVSGANITGVDAGSDKIVFWDDSASELTYLTVGSGLSLTDTTLTATATGGGTKTYAVFTAEHNQPPSTAFATLDTRNSIAVLDFDAATDENAVFVGIMPEAASLGSGLIVRLHWMATTATSGNVRWGVQFERSNTDLDADSFDTAVEATAAANGTSGILTTTAITVTTIDGITAGDVFRLKVFRNADDATNDTMTGDAELVAVEVRSAA
jgi:hypothetical protein